MVSVWLNELDDFAPASPARNAFFIAMDTARGLRIGGLFNYDCAAEAAQNIFQSDSRLLKTFPQVIGDLAGSIAIFIG